MVLLILATSLYVFKCVYDWYRYIRDMCRLSRRRFQVPRPNIRNLQNSELELPTYSEVTKPTSDINPSKHQPKPGNDNDNVNKYERSDKDLQSNVKSGEGGNTDGNEQSASRSQDFKNDSVIFNPGKNTGNEQADKSNADGIVSSVKFDNANDSGDKFDDESFNNQHDTSGSSTGAEFTKVPLP